MLSGTGPPRPNVLSGQQFTRRTCQGPTLALTASSNQNLTGGMMNRTGRTIGAALGAVIFVLFFAELAERLTAATPDSQPVVTVTTR